MFVLSRVLLLLSLQLTDVGVLQVVGDRLLLGIFFAVEGGKFLLMRFLYRSFLEGKHFLFVGDEFDSLFPVRLRHCVFYIVVCLQL